MLYTAFGAHKLTFDQFLALQAQIRHSDMSICKELSNKFYIGAHLQFNTYKKVVEFYL